MRLATRLLSAALCATALLATGCGQATPPTATMARSSRIASQPVVGGPATYEAVGVPQPTKQQTPAGTGQAYTDTTSERPATTGGAATAGGELEAEITAEKNGTFLGMGSYKASVTVTNPTDHRLTGTVTVMFLNKDKPSKTAPVVRPVDVPANGEITIQVEDKKWTTDGAEVEVETDAAPAGSLTAAVLSKKNGIVFGMGKFKAVVEVSNPTGARKDGTLVVTFTNKGEPVEGSPIRQEVSLDAGEKEEFTFEDKHWSTDDVEVEVEME
jgi:hypothetical protein